jgi:hypothetical protein
MVFLTVYRRLFDHIALRALTGCQEAIAEALDALRLPRMSQQDWLRAMSDASDSPQPQAVASEDGFTSEEASGLDSEPLPS